MQHKKLFDVPAKTELRIVKVTCDLCGVDIDAEVGDWERDDVTIERVSGDTFPDGGATEMRAFDVCGKCFAEKLEPWFLTFGAKPRITDTY